MFEVVCLNFMEMIIVSSTSLVFPSSSFHLKPYNHFHLNPALVSIFKPLSTFLFCLSLSTSLPKCSEACSSYVMRPHHYDSEFLSKASKISSFISESHENHSDKKYWLLCWLSSLSLKCLLIFKVFCPSFFDWWNHSLKFLIFSLIGLL